LSIACRRVALVPLIAFGLLAPIAVLQLPVAEAWQAARGRRVAVYVTNEISGDMSVIDAASQKVVATVPLGKRPRGLNPSPDGRFMYVALSGSPVGGPNVDESKLPPPDRQADGIGQLDTLRNRLVRVLKGGTDPEQVAVGANGRFLYVANEDAAQVSVLDAASAKIVRTVSVGGEPEGIALHPSGRFVYATSENEGTVHVIDTTSHREVARVKVGARPRSIGFLPDGSRAYISLENDAGIAVMDAAQHTFQQTITLGDKTVRPMGIAVHPAGREVYVTTGWYGHLFVIEPVRNVSVGSVSVGTRPWGVAVTPDGKWLFTANGQSNDVSIVDVATRRLVKKIPVGTRPWGVAIVGPAKGK
jgi:YVTN family beta-propeller protein